MEEDGHAKVVEVWNKIDRLSEDAMIAIRETRSGENAPLLLSAVTGFGVEELVQRMEEIISKTDERMSVTLAPKYLGQIGWYYDHSQVLEREDKEDGSVELSIRIPRRSASEALSRAGLAVEAIAE